MRRGSSFILEDPGNLVNGDGFQEKSGETVLDKVFLRFDVSGNGIDGKIGETFVRADLGDKFLAVHFGHPDIGQDDVERLFRILNLVPCFSSIDSLHDFADPDLGEKRLQNCEVQCDVIRDQDMELFLELGRGNGCRSRRSSFCLARCFGGKSNKNEMEWTTIIVLVVIFAIIQILGDYCNKHAEEHRQKSWERFEARNAEIMHMVNWNNAVYH